MTATIFNLPKFMPGSDRLDQPSAWGSNGGRLNHSKPLVIEPLRYSETVPNVLSNFRLVAVVAAHCCVLILLPTPLTKRMKARFAKKV